MTPAHGLKVVHHGRRQLSEPKQFSQILPQSWRTVFHFSPLVVGNVLVGAAALKTQRLVISSWVADSILDSRWFQVALAEIELTCGMALLLGIRPRLTRVASMLLFIGFVPVALSRALEGANSCGCLGNVELTPWVMVVGDVVLLGPLSCWQPAPETAERRNTRLSVHLQLPFTAALCGVIAFPLWLLAYGPLLPQLEISSETIDLGVMKQGVRTTFAITMRNRHREELSVERVRTSCPCLEAMGLPWRFPPGEEREVTLALDLSKEPEFRGGLLIEFWEEGSQRRIGFSGKARAKVVSAMTAPVGILTSVDRLGGR